MEGWIGDDGVAHVAVRLLADEDVALPGTLLEPSSDIDRVAGCELLVGRTAPDDHLARVDAGACLDANAVLLREPVVEPLESLSHLQRRPDGPKRIVLVQHRYPEDGDDRVADELLDGAAVTLERCLHRVEVPPHDASERLLVESLPERSGVGDIGEDDRDNPSSVGGARGVSGAPHASQNRASASLARPHEPQTMLRLSQASPAPASGSAR